jgi:precorrin-6A/cobalt-precorrin-6A reductase
VTAGRHRVLLLGGTGEARRLAELLGGEVGGAYEVVYSIAGRVRAPLLPAAATVRVGGFGGSHGLARYLRDERVEAVVDATHPFAATMTGNAAAACQATGVPLVVLRRPGWAEDPVAGDDWRRVASMSAAAAALAAAAARAATAPAATVPGATAEELRVFLTTGRGDLATFADLAGCWFLVRSVDPPDPPTPRLLDVVLDRGPFTVDGEVELMRRHRVDVVVTKDSGGSMTAAKLTAARELGLPVVMVDRPALPPGVAVVTTVDEAVAWLRRRQEPL